MWLLHEYASVISKLQILFSPRQQRPVLILLSLSACFTVSHININLFLPLVFAWSLHNVDTINTRQKDGFCPHDSPSNYWSSFDKIWYCSLGQKFARHVWSWIVSLQHNPYFTGISNQTSISPDHKIRNWYLT